MNKQHAPDVPSWPSPSTQPSSPPTRMCLSVGWAGTLTESIRFGNKIDIILVSDHFEISGIEHGPPACLATATSKVQIVRAWRHENAYAPPLLEYTACTTCAQRAFPIHPTKQPASQNVLRSMMGRKTDRINKIRYQNRYHFGHRSF